MLIRKIGAGRVVFGSEMFGTAHSVDPTTGRSFDDIVPVVVGLLEGESGLGDAVFWRNACRVFPRVSGILALPA